MLQDEMTDIYATHLPVLRKIGQNITIRRVLECGGGMYSTPVFLNRSMFPCVDKVVTVETDPEWIAYLQAKVGFDRRWDLISELPDVGGFDLILIDDGKTPTERVKTIQWITDEKPIAVIVIHDFEQAAYQYSSADFQHRYTYCDAYPQTGILWNGKRPELEGLWRQS